MIRLVLALCVLVSFAGTAQAEGTVSPPALQVSLGKALQAKSAEYGARELDNLKSDLREAVISRLAHAHGGALNPSRIDLIIEDAKPNRPTMAQMGHQPNLSLRSVSLGGARVSGMLVDVSGVSHSFVIEDFQSDLRMDLVATTWTDAERAFDQVASRIVRGDLSGH